MGIDKFNHEGYSDPTTYEALTNINREELAADKKATYLPLVYVCSPYAGDIENNVKNAKAYSRFAVDKNAIPVTPHLLYPQLMDDGNDAEREKWLCTSIMYFLANVRNFGYLVEWLAVVWLVKSVLQRKMKIRWFDHAMR